MNLLDRFVVRRSSWHAGGLYSVVSGKERFNVVKILVVEDGLVHVRLYREVFNRRPHRINPQSLTLGTIYEESFGIGHQPLTADTFESWKPRLIQTEGIEVEELEGYLIWKDSNGAVFGDDPTQLN